MKKPTPCASCQHLGDAAFPTVQYYVDGKMESKLVGFSDHPNGKPTDNPSRKCNHPKMQKTLVYERLDFDWVCPYYEKSQWVRPETCGECQLHKMTGDITTVMCSGHPFCGDHSREERACINGRVALNSQMSLF